ncbi:MAG TPA: hypothetical protein VK634_19675 [Reyranella sp.]|nr:hypothetical protein [Reyranella sp.]HTE82915.1 hypothetical protein [Reyranella sp.]
MTSPDRERGHQRRELKDTLLLLLACLAAVFTAGAVAAGIIWFAQ